MSGFQIDTSAARSNGTAMIDGGDRCFREAATLRDQLTALELHEYTFSTRRRLEQAATMAWQAGTVLHLVCDAVEAGDDFNLADHRSVERIAAIARGLTSTVGLTGWIDRALGASPFGGDLGGTGNTELRTPYTTFGRDPVDRGRHLLTRALADTADRAQIHPDEFEIVQLTRHRYVVVLPGVTDLTAPDPGWHDEHRTVRDIDRAAWSSTWSSEVEHNAYAQMVWSGLRAAGVPDDSELLIVGHSFGADTAIDLATDERFNGDEYRVTHVVAAGYHVDEHLPDVPDRTEVLVLQNRFDVPVIAEAMAHSTVAQAIGNGAKAGADMLQGDAKGAAAHLFGSVRDWFAAARGVDDFIVDHADDVFDLAVGASTNDLGRAGDALVDIATLSPRVEVDGNTIVDVFEGGFGGAGHEQSNYIDHLEQTDEPAVLDFLASIDAAGYATSGSAVALDVSVPRHEPT